VKSFTIGLQPFQRARAKLLLEKEVVDRAALDELLHAQASGMPPRRHIHKWVWY